MTDPKENDVTPEDEQEVIAPNPYTTAEPEPAPVPTETTPEPEVASKERV